MKNIMNVQPLSGPVGLVYYLRYRYAQHYKTEQQDIEVPLPKNKYRSIDDPWWEICSNEQT